MLHEYYNEWHLGDCLWHCIFLRRMARENPSHLFRFFCNAIYHQQLREVINDLGNIELVSLDCRSPTALNVWIAATHKGIHRLWDNHPLHCDIVAFLMFWFSEIAQASNLLWTANQRQDLLFDYPRLRGWRTGRLFDFLVVNGRPGSGQFDYSEQDSIRLIDRLAQKYEVCVTNRCPVSKVFCTEDHGMTVTDIGNLSLWSRALILGATGPCWTSFNIWNQQTYRLVVLRDIEINFGTPCDHADNFRQVEIFLEQQGIL